MQIDRTYRIVVHRGVIFDISEFTVREDNRYQLNTLHFAAVRRHNYQIIEKVKELYDRMQARHLTCVMSVAISKPLNRDQGDMLNDQRWTVTGVISGTVGFAIGKMTHPLVALPAQVGTAAFVANRLPRYHAGDVLIALDAKVHGGIGPQHSSITLIIKS
ncbi:hypothetical protein [Pseudomonas sp. COR18]|uniref:hypothetical protein n=1 Tax=Pseudomonas sp. COR18 TaxID=3399680 RepID=UPI003AFFC2A4